MKILIVSERFYPEVGAAPTRLKNMLDGFISLGNRVDVLTSLPNYPKGEIFDEYKGCFYKFESINESNIYRYWTYATISPNPIKRGLNMLSFSMMICFFAFKVKTCKSYDKVIVQTPTLFTAAAALILFKYLYRKKCILNVSDIWPSTAIDMGAIRKNSLAHKIMLQYEKFLYKKSDAVLGQSEEILKHIQSIVPNKLSFLYRNLQRGNINIKYHKKNKIVKIVYAGSLGIAQDILGLIKNINFKNLGVEFHLYGGGNQTNSIIEYIETFPCNVFYHGYVDKSLMVAELSKYDASIVPLFVRIKGAVPSKIFDILPMGIPILFCGGGEGSDIVNKYKIGYSSNPQDYDTLSKNISKIKALSDEEYIILSKKCIEVSKTIFDFDAQMKNVFDFILTI